MSNVSNEKIDLLLVELPDGTAVGVTAPFNTAHKGDMVLREDGRMGVVVNRLEWLDEDCATKQFVEQILDVEPARKVWQLVYENKEVTSND